MNSIQYCYDKLVQSNSPFYYSLKKIPPAKRDAVVAIAAFYQEIESIILESTDMNVSFYKLNWWRSEVTKILEGSPLHPIIIALHENKIPSERLFEMIDGIAQNLNLLPYVSFEDVVIHIMRTRGVLELMLADFLQLEEKISSEFIYQLTLVLELTHYIQHLRHYVRRDVIYFPQDEMEKFQVTLALLREYKTTPEISALLEFQGKKIERAYQKARENLSPQMIKRFAYLLTRCEMALATWQEIQTSEFCVLENYIHLTPLRMWWIAYRS